MRDDEKATNVPQDITANGDEDVDDKEEDDGKDGEAVLDVLTKRAELEAKQHLKDSVDRKSNDGMAQALDRKNLSQSKNIDTEEAIPSGDELLASKKEAQTCGLRKRTKSP
jgi:hypothetical protein